MPLRYQIIRNSLQPEGYIPRVIQGPRVELAQMIDRIVSRTSLSPTDVQASITALTEELRIVLSSGNTAVIDGLASLSLSLSGNFTTPDISITRENAQVKLVLQADSRLQAAIAGALTYERVIQNTKAPIISSFYDVATETFDRYTSGSIVRIQGDHLKFDRNKLDEGLFVRNGGEPQRITVYSVTGMHQIDALLPLDISGSLQVSVRTRYTPNGELREGRYRQTIDQASS